MRTLLIRGLVAGAAAGLLTFVFAYVFGEGPVSGGIAYEEQAHGAAGHVHGDEVELVSRGVQSTLGLGVAVLVYGVALGGIFALVFAVVQGRFGVLRPRVTAAALAGAGFLVVYLVPFLKYPANPPGSSEGETIGMRTVSYLAMVLLSLAIAVAAARLGRRLAPRLGAWNATLCACGGYIVVVGVAAALMPTIDETPADFPASVLYDFRLASLAGQLVLWLALGLIFGALAERDLAASRPRREGQEVARPA